MRRVAVFEYVQTLPDSERDFTVTDGWAEMMLLVRMMLLTGCN